MKVIQDERGLRIVDFPIWIGILALTLAIFLGAQLVTHILHGAPWRQSAGIGLGLLVAVVAGTLLTQRSDFEFSTAEKKVTWSRRSIFGSSREVIPFGIIEFAVVQCQHSGGNPQVPQTSYRVALMTKDGVVPLTVSYSAGRPSDDRCREIRAAINRMLDVHLASEDDNDIRQLALHGQRFFAERMAAARYGLNSTKAHERVEQLLVEPNIHPAET
jgi:hypothetical protein